MVKAFQSNNGGANAPTMIQRSTLTNKKAYNIHWVASGGATVNAFMAGGAKTGTAAELFGSSSPLTSNTGDVTTAPDAWTDGDTLILSGRITFTSYSVLSASNVMGLFCSRAVASAIAGTADITSRIGFGVNSSGQLILIVADGSAVTATNSGFTAVSGTPFQFELKFVKGTAVYLDIDNSGSPFSISTTMPTMVNAFICAAGASSSSAPVMSLSPVVVFYEGS